MEENHLRVLYFDLYLDMWTSVISNCFVIFMKLTLGSDNAELTYREVFSLASRKVGLFIVTALRSDLNHTASDLIN